jgi:DNA-binding CsgD family transcriptional regulator
MENELSNAKIMLDEYLKSMVEKNELLEQFKTDVEDLKKLKAKEIAEARIENIEILNKTTILTEDDWNKFKELFEQVYQGFFTRLKEKLPDLTQAEIRLVCLSKLKLDTKQMAGILGVSTDTIKKTRYRLRKKLGLSGEDNIEEIDISV